jgi:hypothetical protein
MIQMKLQKQGKYGTIHEIQPYPDGFRIRTTRKFFINLFVYFAQIKLDDTSSQKSNQMFVQW